MRFHVHRPSGPSVVAKEAEARMRGKTRLSKRAWALPGLTAAAAIAIFIADTSTALDIAVATLYVAVVLMASRFLRPRGIALVGLGCVALTLLSWYFSPPAASPTEAFINEFISLGAIGLVTILALQAKKSEAALLDSEHRIREVQMALAHANRLTTMGELVASISHEVRQPISATAVNAAAGARWLDVCPPDLEEARQSFDRIIKDAARASVIIDRIRGLSKKTASSKDRLQINDAIREVVALLHHEFLKHNVAVQTQLAQELPLVEGDRIQLQQVMLNLVMNAIEAMSALKEGPRNLVIETAKDQSGDVLVTVQDCGPGLAAENVDRLFEPFYTTKANGMGMGLAICRSIVQEHGGRLWADTNVARGSVFRFVLPRTPSRAANTHEARIGGS